MKNTFLLFSAFFMFSVSVTAKTAKTAVINLHAINVTESTALHVSDAIRRELSYYSEYDVVSYEDMLKLMNQDELEKSQLWNNPSKADLYAKMLNCSVLFTGSVEERNGKYILILIEINPETNKNEKMIKIERSIQEEKLYFLAEEAVKTIIFAPRGGIQLVSGSEFNSPEVNMVQKGSFSMGNENGGKKDPPVHRVNITHDYMMAKYEISTGEYCSMLNFANANNRIKINRKYVKNTDGDSKILIDLNLNDKGINSAIYYDGKLFKCKEGYDDIPATGITWYGAAFYCNMLSEKENLTPLYDLKNWSSVLFNFKGYRLPTEAEWEYAAKGGRKKRDFLFSGSDNPLETGWIKENADNKLHRTGLLKPNELGIFDLTGNASEWCNDFFDYGYYTEEEITNPPGPQYTAYHVLRGGSFKSNRNRATNSSRDYLNSEKAKAHAGFRPVLIIP